MEPPLLLCDPPREPFWPLIAARPVGDLLAGTRTFCTRWAARAGSVAALWCDRSVVGCAFRSGIAPPLNRWPDPALGYWIALATWVPPVGWEFEDEPAEFRSAGRAVAWRLDPERARALAGGRIASPEEIRSQLADLGLPAAEAGGHFLSAIWEVMAANAEILAADVAEIEQDEAAGARPAGDGNRSVPRAFAGGFPEARAEPGTRAILGDRLWTGSDVSIGPFAVLDAREGGIVLDRGARVDAHAVCRGPLYVGPGSVIMGGTVGPGVSLGPRCKVRGEVESSIFQGYANKAHDGFVGHSVLGEWVNLGAGTVTSDLKNTYGTVRVSGPGERIETSLLKVGSFLGDHVRTGIGTLLATGARLGLGTHLFGGRGVSPGWLPDFSWHDGEERRPVRLESFLRTARLAMARRDQLLGEDEQVMLESLHAAALGAEASVS